MNIICLDKDIAEGEGRRFLSASHDLLIIRCNGKLHGFRNECPHMAMPLTNRSKVLFDNQQGQLSCMQHGAVFDLKTGDCLNGPCVGMKLKKADVVLEDDKVMLNE